VRTWIQCQTKTPRCGSETGLTAMTKIEVDYDKMQYQIDSVNNYFVIYKYKYIIFLFIINNNIINYFVDYHTNLT